MVRAAVFAFLLLAPVPAGRGGEGLRLDEALREALASNPELLAARKASEAAAARIPQAAALNDPLLELEYDRINADRMATGRPMQMYSITQELPFPVKLYYRAKIASRIARAAHANYLAKEHDIAARVAAAVRRASSVPASSLPNSQFREDRAAFSSGVATSPSAR